MIDVERWLRYARVYLNRLLHDWDDADSLAGITLASALRRWDPSQGPTWKSYLIVSLRRAAREELKARRLCGMTKRGSVAVEREPARVPLGEDLPYRRDWVRVVDARIDCATVLRRLEPRDQVVLSTWAVGLSFTELAEALGMRRSTAHVHFQDAITHARAIARA